MGDRIVIMNGGHICQVGTAMDVYDHPATRFVAGFIGTPPMNFFDGEIAAGGEVLLSGGIRLRVPRPELAPMAGRKISFGMRPEHIALSANGRPHAGLVPSTIEVIEPLGNRSIVTARCAAGVLQLEVEGHPALEPDQAADLFFDLARAHLFDQATECAI